MAYIGGANHEITLSQVGERGHGDLEIVVGGYLEDIRLLDGSENRSSKNHHRARNINLKNFTLCSVKLTSDSSENNVRSCGEIDDEGKQNQVTHISCESKP